METKQCCGTCRYSEWNSYEREYQCVNDRSDNYGLDTEYGEVCDDWEEHSGR